MATVITKTKGKTVVTANATDGAITIAEMQTAGLTITKADIVEVFWTVNGTNTWLIDRGGTALAQYAGSGNHDYSASGLTLATGNTSDMGLTLSGGTGFIVVIVHTR